MTVSIRRSARLLARTADPTTLTTATAKATAVSATDATTGRVAKSKRVKSSKSKGKQSDIGDCLPVVVLQAEQGNGAANPRANAKPESTFQSLADPGAIDEAIRFLKDADPKLAHIIDRTTEKCAMGLPRESESDTNSYISLCQSIIYQQLAGKAAEAILLRFLKRYGARRNPDVDHSQSSMSSSSDGLPTAPALSIKDFVFPSAEQVAGFDVDEMKAVGLGQRKAEYLKEVAINFRNGTLSEERLAMMSDDEVSQALVSIRGIGQWTADMFLMFHLKRPNVLPTLDLAVRKAMCQHFGVPFGKKTPTHDQMVRLGEIWEPYRSVATWYMWRSLNTVTQES
ncbi:hypothetical protein GGH99_001970 [Coemansia sp. RSA 1285]|nr:hypothetical protein EV177_005386 [Coemansia sp. RSA 1804]KAJ2692070.1 hypothetical protein GGH99_001970 [Coemansia sp. RSA 1285]